MLEIVGLGLGRAEGCQRLEGQRRAAPRAALIQQQHPIALQCHAQPAGRVLRPRRRRTRPALQEDQPGQVVAGMGRCHDLTRIDGDLFALRLIVVEGQAEVMVGHREAGQMVGTHGRQTPHFWIFVCSRICDFQRLQCNTTADSSGNGFALTSVYTHGHTEMARFGNENSHDFQYFAESEESLAPFTLHFFV